MYFRGGHGFAAIGCEIEGPPPLRAFLTPSLSPSLLLGLWTALKLGVVVGGGGGWWWCGGGVERHFSFLLWAKSEA